MATSVQDTQPLWFASGNLRVFPLPWGVMSIHWDGQTWDVETFAVMDAHEPVREALGIVLSMEAAKRGAETIYVSPEVSCRTILDESGDKPKAVLQHYTYAAICG